MSRAFAFLFSATATVPSLGGAQAATTQSPTMPGHFLERPSISIGVPRQRCLDLGDDTYDTDVRQIGVCARLGFSSLGMAGGHRWYSALFGRRWLLPASGTTPADTAAESEVVVFIADTARPPGRDTLLTPMWHYRFEPEMLASVTPEIVSIAGGGALVGINECVNGTGGCAQSFFVRGDTTWRVVRLAFVDSLNRRFPGAINHGFRVDLRTLRATAAVYSPNDANCCPSRSAEMQLQLRNGALEIVQLRVRALTPLRGVRPS